MIDFDPTSAGTAPLRILAFTGDSGFVHESKSHAERMLIELGEEHGWQVTATADPTHFTENDLGDTDVIVFANNCGTESAIFTTDQQAAFQDYIRSGGGFVGIHCAGAIWHESGDFQQWYESLIGARLVAHPHVQRGRLRVEDRNHISTFHLPPHWEVTDEWHFYDRNPRPNVHVLLSLDESSYHGKPKMQGDHPASWFQEYDGGRSFFTTLGHTNEIYDDPLFRHHVLGGIRWAAGQAGAIDVTPVAENRILDLDADHGVELAEGDRVTCWTNQVAAFPAREFVQRDEGRDRPGSGRPTLKLRVPEIRYHNALVFHRQELVNHDEDAFDHLITGSGYTWLAVVAPYTQIIDLKDVNSIFGNLRNDGNYEGIWGNLTDDNRPWMGSRNGITFGRWDENNPMVAADEPLVEERTHLLIGRMGAGTGEVDLELFVNDPATPVARGHFPVNPAANSSKMAIGQERDATNHPGKEAFDGELARLLIYDRPLSDEELAATARALRRDYLIGE